MAKQNKSPSELIGEKLLSGMMKIDELNFDDCEHVKAVIEFLRKNPSIIKTLGTPNEIKAILLLLKDGADSNGKKGFEYIANVQRSQLTDEIVSTYLFERLSFEQQEHQNDLCPLTIDKTYDDHILIGIGFRPFIGSHIAYFDKDLQIPVTLKYSIDVTFKIKNSLLFAHDLDTQLVEFGYCTIQNKFINWVNKSARFIISDLVINQGVGYYELMSKYSAIEKLLVGQLNNNAKSLSIEIANVSVKEISLLEKDIPGQLADQYFDTRINMLNQEVQANYEKQSLTNYERKIAIQNKYPNVTEVLTEAEKDNVFNRYARKVGAEVEEAESIGINRYSLKPQHEIKQDNAISEVTDVKEDLSMVIKNKKIATFFFILCLASITAYNIFHFNYSELFLGFSVGIFIVLTIVSFRGLYAKGFKLNPKEKKNFWYPFLGILLFISCAFALIEQTALINTLINGVKLGSRILLFIPCIAIFVIILFVYIKVTKPLRERLAAFKSSMKKGGK